MFSDHNEGNSVVAERFIRTLKSKIFKNITTDGIKFCSRFLNKLVGECNNTFILSSFYWQKIYWSMLIYIDLRSILTSWLMKSFWGIKLLNLKLVIPMVKTKYNKQTFLANVIPIIGHDKNLWLITSSRVIFGDMKLKL